MKHQHLMGGLFLGSLLILCSCKQVPERAEPTKRDLGTPKKVPDLRPARRGARPSQPDARADSAKGLGRYRSCDELQEAVRGALSFKKKNDATLAVARKRPTRRPLSTLQNRSERTTSAGARPGGAPPPAAKAAAPKQPAKELEQFTNIQEVGVDEPDHVKIGPDNIYLLRGREIQVASRKTLRHRGVVRLQQLNKAKKLLITARHLFVLGEIEQRICSRRVIPRPGGGRILRPRKIRQPKKRRPGLGLRLWRLLVPEAHAMPGDWRRRRPHPRIIAQPCASRVDTAVQAYRLRADGLPEHVRSWRFKGRYVDARMTAGRIVLVFQQRLNLVPQVRAVLDNPSASLASTPIPRRPIVMDTRARSALLSCSAIYRSNMFDQDYRLTKVVGLDAKILSETPKQAGFVGGGDQIYMSTENLYIAKVGKRWLPRRPGPRDRRSIDARARAMRDSLVITQIGFAADSGEITVLAQTDRSLQGRPKDQWAFKELKHEGKSLLGVFTTTGKMWSKDPADITNNHLWILKRSGSELPVVAKLSNIARGESIRSLRYIGKWAYAVTFKKTDPLFAIDLSDPLSPKIVGELKIPGFSTYMHPVGEGRLIGIGFDVFVNKDAAGAAAVKFQGIKLSLFDISNPRDMRELDTMTFGARGSYSDVTKDHHAFFYDAKLKRLAFPMTLLTGAARTDKWQGRRRIGFAGAVLVQIRGRKLERLARWRHNRWIPLVCYEQMRRGRWWEAKTESLDISRIYRIGERYLTASRFGLKTYSVRTPQITRLRLRFPGEFTECSVARD